MTIHDMNNHLRGTEFDVERAGEGSPIRRGVVTIDGTVLKFSVFAERIGMKGLPYYPVKLEYAPDSKTKLVSVPVDEGGEIPVRGGAK